MRALVPGLLVGLSACGPSELQVLTDDYAIEMAGDGCMTASSEPIAIGSAITLEAWVRGNPTPSRPNGAIVALGDAVMLWTSATTTGVTEPAEEPVTGFVTQTSLYDGERHHVAAVWSQAEGGALYIDGLRYGLGPSLAPPVAAEEIWVGCLPSANRYFDGVIDEVRLSTQARYPENFVPQDGPFEPDDYTLALWHLDTGSGDVAFDTMELFDASLDGAVWVKGLVRGEGAADTGDTQDTQDTSVTGS